MPTLGELQAAGWHGIEAFCRRCRIFTVVFWVRLRQRPEVEFEAVQRRLICRRCGERPAAEDVRPYYQDTAHADPLRAPPPPRASQAGVGPVDGPGDESDRPDRGLR